MIIIPLPDGNAESVTADQLPDDTYRVTSIPVFTEQVHYQDIVVCAGDPPVFSSIQEASGYVTVQVVFTKDDRALCSPKETAPFLAVLTDASIHVEHVAGKLYIASFPAERYSQVEQVLDDYPQALLRWWH